MNDEVLSSLVKVLISKCDPIKTFGLACCHEITIICWLALSADFLTLMPELKFLLIGNENFNDNAMVALARACCVDNSN